MDISKIYESAYKNTLSSKNTLARLSQDGEFAKLLEQNTKKNSNPEIENVDLKLLKEQTDAFEAFMIKNVLDISLKLENPLFGKDAGDEIYSSMYNDAISKALSGGLGFSELLYNFLRERV